MEIAKNCICHISYKILTYYFFYLEACKSSGYNPLFKSSLWMILASVKPSRRKSLGGFDNLTTSGINGFETILKLASKYRIEKTLTEAVQNGKRYFKPKYQMHGNYSHGTHSLLFALSGVNKTCLKVASTTK